MKILVCGSVHGRLNAFFYKLTKIMGYTGSFDSVFCVGEFLSEDISEYEAYRDGRIICPVPTFFIGPTNPKLVQYYPVANGASICSNLIYLGRRGVLTTEEGLRIVYLSGLETGEDKDILINFSDIELLDRDLIKTGRKDGIDILLTSAIPAGIEFLQEQDDLPLDPLLISPVVAKLAAHLKPRYHFANGDTVYHEPLPYRNHKILQEREIHATRFIALINSLCLGKEKGMYGIKITPMINMDAISLCAGSAQAVDSPYTNIIESPMVETATYTSNYFFENPLNSKSTNCDVMTSPCWFCPGEKSYQSHLVASIGNEVYLSLSRGGLTNDHMMIVPIEHISSSVHCSSSTLAEIQRYKDILIDYYDKEHNCDCIFYERFLKTVHMQVQCVAVPKHKSSLVHIVFREYLEQLNLTCEEIDTDCDISKLVNLREPFFYLDLPNRKRLFMRLLDGGLHLHFIRIVLASDRILEVPNRGFNWKNCLKSKAEEENIVLNFRKSFMPYDPFLSRDQ